MGILYTYEDFSNVTAGSYGDPLHYFSLWDWAENIAFCQEHDLPSPPDYPVERSYSMGPNADAGLYPVWAAFTPDQRDAYTRWANVIATARWNAYQEATLEVAAIGAVAAAMAARAIQDGHDQSVTTSTAGFTFADFVNVKFASYDDKLHYFSLWTIEENAAYCRANGLPKPPVIPVVLWVPEEPNMRPGFRPDWYMFSQKEQTEYTVWANQVADRRWYEYRGAMEGVTIRITADDESLGEPIDFAELQSQVDKLNSRLVDQDDWSFTTVKSIHEIGVGDEISFWNSRTSVRTLH